MNQLKWYDFLGALILLFSVTKSAIKPPEVTDHASTHMAPSATTIFNSDSHKIVPREAALSQVDMLSPSTSADFIRNIVAPEVHDERTNVSHVEVSTGVSSPTAKSLPKTAPRVETQPSRNVNTWVALRPLASSHIPVFIC